MKWNHQWQWGIGKGERAERAERARWLDKDGRTDLAENLEVVLVLSNIHELLSKSIRHGLFKNRWSSKHEQGEEFMHVVLDGRSSQQKLT